MERTKGGFRVTESRAIVFFDGFCGLCNGTVDRLLKWDSRNRLLFSPLQGTTAADLLGTSSTSEPDAIVYLRQGTVYRESSAILRILRDVGGWRVVLGMGLVVPTFLRDPVYRFVARHRYRWFGRRAECRLPSPEERGRFLP